MSSDAGTGDPCSGSGAGGHGFVGVDSGRDATAGDGELDESIRAGGNGGCSVVFGTVQRGQLPLAISLLTLGASLMRRRAGRLHRGGRSSRPWNP